MDHILPKEISRKFAVEKSLCQNISRFYEIFVTSVMASFTWEKSCILNESAGLFYDNVKKSPNNFNLTLFNANKCKMSLQYLTTEKKHGYNRDKPTVSLFVRPKIASGDLPFPEQMNPGGRLRATSKTSTSISTPGPAMRTRPYTRCRRLFTKENSGYMISPRGKGAPRVLRGRAAPVTRGRLHEARFARALVSSRANGEDSRGTCPPSTTACRCRSCKDGGQWSREEEDDLSYETSHNCTPIGPAEECNLSLSSAACICESRRKGKPEVTACGARRSGHLKHSTLPPIVLAGQAATHFSQPPTTFQCERCLRLDRRRMRLLGEQEEVRKDEGMRPVETHCRQKKPSQTATRSWNSMEACMG
ncbi:Uncharacterized protein DBV15_06267 [Temnothorax longispinosus]|uniref:Uncharacterized protein n=1 Tax=Temnothorax longispinosus TaxID=300112 RepID=A0A4S2KFM7_9HYME|nr:Uncharacterized protein DBV15_06267 [Temnothorax longispinosus]